MISVLSNIRDWIERISLSTSPETPTPMLAVDQMSRDWIGHFILMRIIEIVATRCQILKLKCTEFDIGWGSARDPALRAYSAPHTIGAFKGPTSREARKGREGQGVGEQETGKKGKGWEVSPAFLIPPDVGARIVSAICV